MDAQHLSLGILSRLFSAFIEKDILSLGMCKDGCRQCEVRGEYFYSYQD